MGAFSREMRATLLISLLVVGVAGCSKPVNDEMLAKDVQDKLAADPVTRDAAVNVTAKDGKVTLRGTVKDAATQQRLEQIAHEEPGASGVEDQTAVLPPPAAEQAAAQPQAEPSPQAAPPPPPPEPVVVPAGT